MPHHDIACYGHWVPQHGQVMVTDPANNIKNNVNSVQCENLLFAENVTLILITSHLLCKYKKTIIVCLIKSVPLTLDVFENILCFLTFS